MRSCIKNSKCSVVSRAVSARICPRLGEAAQAPRRTRILDAMLQSAEPREADVLGNDALEVQGAGLAVAVDDEATERSQRRFDL
jgi:hypothetical protein